MGAAPVTLSAMSPRRMVLVYTACTVLGWISGAVGLTRLPSLGYVLADIVLDAGVIVGLWLLWCPVWVVSVAVTLVGELLFALHPSGRAVLLAIGAIQLAVLLLPPLRRGVRSRPSLSKV